MKDIKINKKVNIKKSVEKIEELYIQKPHVSEDFKQSEISKFSASLFGFMALSVFCYIFLISASVFYAVQEREFVFNGESVSNLAVETAVDLKSENVNSKKISYINKNADTAISIK